MLKADSQTLNVAVACASIALREAEDCRMQHLVGVASRKMVIMPVEELRALVEAAWEVLETRGIIRNAEDKWSMAETKDA